MKDKRTALSFQKPARNNKEIICLIVVLMAVLISPDGFCASNYKEIRSLKEEKKYLVSLYQRKQKNSKPEELSGITLRLNEIQRELDGLGAGGKTEDDHAGHGHRRNGSRMGSPSNNY